MKTVIVHYCPCGHVSESSDPEDTRKSKEREKKGFLDALPKFSEDCPQCQCEGEIRNRRLAEAMEGWK